MAYKYEIDKRMVMVRLNSVGPSDFAEWEETMRTLVRDPAFMPGMPVLFDIRLETTLPPPGESGRLADGWRRFVPGSSIAIVAPPGGAAYGVVRQVSARSNGQVEAFTEIRDAEAWLQRHRHHASM
jgi:hypothetical protein